MESWNQQAERGCNGRLGKTMKRGTSYFILANKYYSDQIKVVERNIYNMHGKSKGKAVPLRSIEAHLDDRRYSSYSFLTSALEGGEWSA
jgi:hypothetical protein